MADRFVTQRVTLDITVRVKDGEREMEILPESWNYAALMDIGGENENISLVSVETIPTSVAHMKEMIS